MAIIYTYPVKAIPSLHDSIVITDEADDKKTKITGIGAIIALITGDFCTTSMSQINPDVGDVVTAVDCATVINFTSSDASVTITGNDATKTIDFKSTGGGGGGCPTTYVIKPVYCEDTVCYIGELQSEWIYTCDETLGALAPGYINNLTITGIPVESESGCWYIEQATFSATTTTCEVCCGGATPTYSYEKCDEAGVFVTVDVDPGHSIGKTFTYCCYPEELDQTVKCWEYVGDVGEPVGGTFDPCIEFGDPGDDCDCCINRCNYTYTACTPIVGGFPATLTFDVGMDPTSICVCNGPVPHDIVVQDQGSLETWCYTDPYSTCDDADDVGYDVIGAPAAPCDDPDHCPASPTYTWQKCDGGPYVTVPVDPGIPVGQIDRFCCDGEPITHHCYEYLGSIGEPVAGMFPCVGPFESYPSDCECCLNPCTYKYTACPGYDLPFSEFIWVGVDFDVSGCDCNIPDPDIYIQIDGATWCYSNPVKECVPGSTIPAGIAVCGDPEKCPVDLRWKICSEVDPPNWKYEDPLDPIPAPFNVPGNHYVGELHTPGTCVNGDCCIEVEATISLGPTEAWSTFIAATSCDDAYNDAYDDCDCCIHYDVAEYTTCDEACEPGDGPLPIVNIDVCAWGNVIGQSWKPASAPDFIKIHDCCYEKTGDVCEAETFISGGYLYGDLTYDPNFDDCNCVPGFQFRECGTELWIDTDTDLSAYNNGGAWENAAGDTCYEIQEGGTGGPVVDPAVLFVTEYFGVGPLSPCDCCKQDLREYIICTDPVCNALAPTTLYIDVSSIVGYDPVTYATIVGEEISSNIQCCYTYVDSPILPCDLPTGIIISAVSGCGDAACNLI